MSLPAWGAWIEIYICSHFDKITISRSPHGGRGLKLYHAAVYAAIALSLPAWGAWIEIISVFSPSVATIMSLPAWGAWIEILKTGHLMYALHVAPRMGGVD